jgi:hypothetical protein
MPQNHLNLGNTCAIIALIFFSASQLHAQPSTVGGLLEHPGSAVARAAIAKNQINNFVPDRGTFRFPAPYNTQGVRLTNASDCGGNDCVNYAGYSYWRNMNNHVGKESMLIFLGLDRNRGGRGPSLYELNKSSGALVDLGGLFPEAHRLSWASGEGWYFSATMPTTLYLNDGPKLVRFDVITEQMQTVFDITNQLGEGYNVLQLHSSDNDRVHSATVRENKNFQVQGCMTYEENTGRYQFFPIKKDFDECQIDRSGEFLIIKANIDGKHGEDNLIVTLRTGEQRVLLDENGAGGHSDVGHGYMIAADNWAKEANNWKIWDLTQQQLKGKTVYHNNDWQTFAPAHVSHTNARADLHAQQQYACGSSVNQGKGVHANEVMCFNLDGSGTSVAVAPTMTNLNAPGGGNEYARLPKGNLDVSGKYFLWTSNMDGGRLDVFVVRVPDHLLTGIVDHSIAQGSYSPPSTGEQAAPLAVTDHPAVIPTSPAPVNAVDTAVNLIEWHQLSNLQASGNTLTKVAGCSGCADAGMVSAQPATPEFARIEFTAQSTWELLVAGFTRTQAIPEVAALEFGLSLQNDNAEVREQGVYRADIKFRQGDRFSVTIRNGKVEYARNDVVFYTSARTATQLLYSGLTFYNQHAAVDNVVFSSVQSNSASPLASSNKAGSEVGAEGASVANNVVAWQHAQNAQNEGGWLVKNGGCHGCADSGMISSRVAAGTYARIDFTAESTGPLLFAGFGRSQSIPDSNSLEFGLRLQNGLAEVREHGGYRADISFRQGDRFSIDIKDGRIFYLHNGTVFYTSYSEPKHPLYAGISFYSMGATLANVVFQAD